MSQQKRGLGSSFKPRWSAFSHTTHREPPVQEELCGNRDVSFRPQMLVTLRPEYRQRLSKMFGDQQGPFKLADVQTSVAAEDLHVHPQRLYMKGIAGINGMYFNPLAT